MYSSTSATGTTPRSPGQRCSTPSPSSVAMTRAPCRALRRICARPSSRSSAPRTWSAGATPSSPSLSAGGPPQERRLRRRRCAHRARRGRPHVPPVRATPLLAVAEPDRPFLGHPRGPTPHGAPGHLRRGGHDHLHLTWRRQPPLYGYRTAEEETVAYLRHVPVVPGRRWRWWRWRGRRTQRGCRRVSIGLLTFLALWRYPRAPPLTC
jgi:hypothetical protein